jgi:predicted DNA-binding protein
MQRELLSEADMAASLISGRGTYEHKAQVHPIMVRLPIYTVSKIDALCKHTGKSRAGVMQLLLSVGWEEVTARLDETVLASLVQLDAEALSELLGEDAASQKVL